MLGLCPHHNKVNDGSHDEFKLHLFIEKATPNQPICQETQQNQNQHGECKRVYSIGFYGTTRLPMFAKLADRGFVAL